MSPLGDLDSSTGLRLVLDSLGEGVTLANPDGRIVFSNRAADRILGVEATSAPPETWADHYGVFLPDGVTPFPTDAYPLLRALAGEETRDVEMFIRNGGVPEGVRIAVTGRPLRDLDGELVGAAVVFRDVTALRAAEGQLRRANEVLNETLRTKDELFAFVVHDLKSPLTVILGQSDLLLAEAGLEGDDATGLRDLREAARYIERRVMELLDMGLGEDGALVPEREVITVTSLLQDALRALGPRAATARQRIVSAGAPKGLAVEGDRDLLDRVLQNLVDNCVKYGREGGTIWLRAEAAGGGRVLLRVSDDGPGVPPQLRETIFEKYARVERDARPRSRHSRGLGLRFCKVAVEAQRGEIWVEDNVPRGASFCLALPAARSA